MTGVWSESADGWRALPPMRFSEEKELHDLIERNPSMLPLAGSPQLVVLGREVQCGNSWADLVAVDADTGTPVVLEIKLASNADRRQVLTQVLGYAAHLRRLDAPAFESLLSPHLSGDGLSTVTEAVSATVQDESFDATAFTKGLHGALDDGRLRCVVVIDAAPADLVELFGYLQEVSNDRLDLDLVTVTAYEAGGRRILVPQLVEPQRASGLLTPPQPRSAGTTVTRGPSAFGQSAEEAPAEQQGLLRRLYDWALDLERDGLAVLYSSTGNCRWVLNPRLPGQQRGLVTVWNEQGGSLSPYRTVFAQEAPKTLAELDRHYPGQIGQGNYVRADYEDALLALVRQAYEEAARR